MYYMQIRKNGEQILEMLIAGNFQKKINVRHKAMHGSRIFRIQLAIQVFKISYKYIIFKYRNQR